MAAPRSHVPRELEPTKVREVRRALEYPHALVRPRERADARAVLGGEGRADGVDPDLADIRGLLLDGADDLSLKNDFFDKNKNRREAVMSERCRSCGRLCTQEERR